MSTSQADNQRPPARELIMGEAAGDGPDDTERATEAEELPSALTAPLPSPQPQSCT